MSSAVPELLFRDIRWWSRGVERRGDLRLRRGVIDEIGIGLQRRRGEAEVDMQRYLALPGLINAHDHLGLNLLPPLGRPPYESFYSWAEEIHRPHESPVREILSVHERDRLLWGAYRNLCSGVTTVLHHDPYRRRVFSKRFPVRIPRIAWSHSLGLGKHLERDHRRAGESPWVIHAAEGIDERARQEVDRLDELGLLGPRTVLVHGIGITEDQAARLEELGVGLIWCPASNLRLYGETAPVHRLRESIRVVLGTDSTLSGSATLLEELGIAMGTGFASKAELLEMVTSRPAELFGLDRGEGSIEVDGVADLILLEDDGSDPADQLLAVEPGDLSLVIVAGKPSLADEALADTLDLGPASQVVFGRPYFLDGDLDGLRRRIEKAAGGAVLCESALWSRIGGEQRS